MSGRWRKLSMREYPFNEVANYRDGQMGIDTVVAPAAGKQLPAVLYTAFYGHTGTQPQDFMKGKLDLLTKDLQVKER
jgi:serine protease Do